MTTLINNRPSDEVLRLLWDINSLKKAISDLQTTLTEKEEQLVALTAPAPAPPQNTVVMPPTRPFTLRTPEFSTISEAMKAGRTLQTDGKKIIVNCPLGNPAWDTFKSKTGRAEGNMRVDRILEALDELAKNGCAQPTIDQLKKMVLLRHRRGNTYPCQTHVGEEEYIIGPRSCTQNWLCYMKTYGLIDIVPV
jgi:hypothetical protein